MAREGTWRRGDIHKEEGGVHGGSMGPYAILEPVQRSLSGVIRPGKTNV